MTRPTVPLGIGIYLGVVQFFFALCWTVYLIFFPRLADQVGLPRSWLLPVLMVDQAIFTITDFAMGVAADRVANLVGRLGRIVAAITALSCAAFLALPLVAGAGPDMQPVFLALTAIWIVTSSALRAPPLVLIGKYAARPSIPWLSTLIVLGIGVAGALAPYLSVQLRNLDPRWPFALSSAALVLTTLGLVHVERRLAKQATPEAAAEARPAASSSTWMIMLTAAFILAVSVLAIGFQLHFFVDSAPLFRKFAEAAKLEFLMPVFWIGFNVALFPAGWATKRTGGLAVMGVAGVIGAAGIAGTHLAGNLHVLIACQFIAGAAWGAILMSAVAAALSIGHPGRHEGRVTGLLFSALALVTLLRIAAVAGGFTASGAAASTALQWTPSLSWLAAGAAVLILLVVIRPNPQKPQGL
jgi:hypothetical protein